MTTTAPVDLATAYRACEQVTRSRARNFFYGIRLLPPAKRSALCAVYAFARRVDDVGDGELPVAAKRAALGELRASLDALGARPDDPVLVALADAARRLPIPLGALAELVDGVQMDVDGVRYPDLESLVGYCRRVAGTIGRLSLGVFGSRDPVAAPAYADTLGVALQLTNILRDVGEDRADGRLYLPEGDCARFGWDPQHPTTNAAGFAALVRFEAARAEAWYREGLRLLPLLDRRSAACTAAMAGIYRRLLARIAAEPAAVLQRRVSLTGREKAAVAVRSLAGARR